MDKEQNNYIFQILIHLVFGGLMFYVGVFPRLFFYLVVIYFLVRIIISPAPIKTFEILKACAYMVGAEVLFRTTNGAIFYEASKYLVILFVILGVFYKGVSGKAYAYFIYLIALVPSVVVASALIGFDANFRTNIAFVLSGPVCLGVAALYFYDKKVNQNQLLEVLTHLSLPIVSMSVYVYLYTPRLEDVLTGTESNYATSGGFGPNQTATILGLGMFAFVVRFFLKSPGLLLKLFNVLIFGMIAYRAVITFSRGGVVGAVIMIIAFMAILYFRSNRKQKNHIISSFIILMLAVSTTWVISSNRTQGLIDKRYSNQDARGRVNEDVTTGRVDLFIDELDGFLRSPFLGVGASGMKEERIIQGRRIVSHNELSRVLSEHGILGIFILLILLIKPLTYRTNNKGNYFFYAFMAFWFATINHSAMRIAAPGFIYALALLNVIHEKRIIHRKRAIQNG